jgi:2-polyprenyl-3-methyl-5-hydroxy-6-metoxy-1,4-benzoquinol methylase
MPRSTRRLPLARNAGRDVVRRFVPSRSRAVRVRAVGGVCSLPRMSAQGRGSSLKRVARRLARPVLSPIDGRVGDINRRIEHTRESVERQRTALEALAGQSERIDSYARSSAEAFSYVGVELRRIQETLETLNERTLEEYYQLRLAGVRQLTLSELDEPLAQVIEYATSHRGFYAQAGLWFNPPVVVSLKAGTASAVEVTERIVELPFAMAALSQLKPGARILDVGSAESTFPLSAASLGYQVTAIDPRPLRISHQNLKSFACLLEDWQPQRERFAAAFLISTIEHVGLGAYGEQSYGCSRHGVGADRAVLDRIRGLLAPDGLMILTTPYGKREITELERIYDEASFTKLLDGWKVLKRQFVVRRDALVWEPADTNEPGARGVVMVIAVPQ